jgi:hypothetical protein
MSPGPPPGEPWGVRLRWFRECVRRETREEFAEAINKLARQLQVNVNCGERLVARWEDGDIRCPRPVYQRLLAGLDAPLPSALALPCSRPADVPSVLADDAEETAGALVSGQRGPAEQCGAGEAAAASGLLFADGWMEGVGNAVQLWRHDAERRRLLRTSAFTAAAFATPAMRWLTAYEPDRPERTGALRVGPPEVDTIREMTAVWRRLDNRYGGGHAREAAVSYLHGQVAPLLRDGRYDASTGAALFSAAAELTQQVGWMGYDSPRHHGLAQRYFIQALRLAQAGADVALGAEILAGMSHQAVYLGHGASGVDLARAARAAAVKAGVAALVAEAHVMEAHALAVVGDERACTAALTAAERTLDVADREHDPQWIGYFGEAYLAAKFGHCFAALGHGDQAERFAHRSLDMDDRYVRGKVFNLALLAGSYLSRPRPEPEQACAVGTEAVALAADLRSARAVHYLTELGGRLVPFGSLPVVRDFLSGLAAVSGGPSGEAVEEHRL